MEKAGLKSGKPGLVDDEFLAVQDKGEQPPPDWRSWLVFHAVLGMVHVLVLSVVVPRFEVIFADFGVALPVPTRILVQASHAVIRHVLPSALVLSLLFGLDFGMFTILSSGQPRSRAAGTWGLACSIALMAGLAAVVAAFLVPLADLIHRLSG